MRRAPIPAADLLPAFVAAKRAEGDYYEIAWYLRELDTIQQEARVEGRHPAAVSAVRTMAELVGLVGPAVGNVDARVQVLALPEGLSESALIALATGAYLTDQSTELVDVLLQK